jgi:aspartate dehydrogenase
MANPLRVGVGGLGAIGLNVTRALDDGIDGLQLVAVSARNREAAAAKLAGLRRPVPVVTLAELAALADIVVECVPAAAYAEVADAAVEAGCILMTLSCGQLLQRPDLIDKAKASGARIIIPTGALIGLDAVRAAAEGHISSATIITRKPPKSLIGAPYLEENNIDLSDLTEALRVFKGTARDGARGFPANVNVAAALSLAGIGPDATGLEIWADPDIERNTHRIRVEADSARFEMTIENVPSEDKPATGKITALSTIAALRGLTATLKVGT